MSIGKLMDDLRKQPPETWLLLIFFGGIALFRIFLEYML